MDSAYNGLTLNKKSKASRSFDNGKFYGNLKGEELRVSNSRNPRPILYPNSSSLRKTAPGNFGVSSMVAPRRGTSSNVSGMNYGARKPELFQKPFCGSVNSKSTIENNPQITNMTSIGLMNAIQPSPSNHKFTALEAEPPMLSPIRSKIQPPKTFFYREFQAEKSEPRLTSMDNANTMNQMKSTQEKHSNNSFMSHSFPVSNSRSGSKLMENATENGNFEEENEVLLSGSDSSDSSFGSVTFKTKQTCGTPLHKWQTNHNLYNNDNVYGRNDLKTGKDSAPANQTLMQDFRVIAYFGYDVAKSIVYFMMAASLIWTCSALMFEVVPFPVHFRDTLYELMSYKKPEPKYGLVVWINKVFRLITKMIGTNCNL